MRPKLILQPIHNSSADILQSFASGKPLTSDQMRFLEWHQRELSSAEFDPVLKYYLEYYKKHHQKQYQATFLLPHEELNFEDIQRLKKRIKLFIQKNAHRVAIGLSQTVPEVLNAISIMEIEGVVEKNQEHKYQIKLR